MTRICKTDQIRIAWAAGDQIGALRIAARFFDQSGATKTFQRGMDAHNHPHFYRQIGKRPEQIVATALNVLASPAAGGEDHFFLSLIGPRIMSALPPKADITNCGRDVCFVPIADIALCQ